MKYAVPQGEKQLSLVVDVEASVKVTFEDFCPCCGEMCIHMEDEDSYSVECHSCNTSRKWKSLDEFMEWDEAQREKRIRNASKRARKEARRLTSYDNDY